MPFVVYRLQCSKNGKNYIGVTGNLKHRMIIHRTRFSKTLISKAIRKYGFDAFQLSTLFERDTAGEVFQKEIQAIRHFDSRHPGGYNQTDGGEGVPGLHHSLKTKVRMSRSHLGKGCGPDNPMFGKPGTRLGSKWSDENRKKISESCRGRIPWNKGKTGLQTAWNKGKTGIFSEEVCKRISEKNTGKVRSAEARAKLSASHKGKNTWSKGSHHSPETREKMRQSHLGSKRAPFSEEHRRKMSEVARRRWLEGGFGKNCRVVSGLAYPETF